MVYIHIGNDVLINFMHVCRPLFTDQVIFKSHICLRIFKLLVYILYVLFKHEQAHIGDILRSKFGDFKTFHTLLYTCAKEFDFLEYETYTKLTMTGLIPSMLVACFIVAFTVRANCLEIVQVAGQLSGRVLDQGLRSLLFNPLPRHPVVEVSSSHTSSSCCSYQHHATEARFMGSECTAETRNKFIALSK